ncbi:hypothetical protein ACLE20_08615 [Rhizobium sp. YIM 134829]|uniref:hypothetical protein n=1 Tax=Rhizobium sp. YIM 134829 TaxID=3390453 RepID=UPI00397D22A0
MTDASNADLARNAGFGSDNQTEPSALDMERQPQPADAPETTSSQPTRPPLPLGPASGTDEPLVEGEPDTNPTHHRGHVPPPVTANRD